MLMKNVKKIQCFFMLAYTTSKQCNQDRATQKRAKWTYLRVETAKELHKFLLFNRRITSQCCKQSCH